MDDDRPPPAENHCPEQPVHEARFDPESASPALAVVEAVAAAGGEPPVEVRPRLAVAVDPDALDALFRARLDGTPRTGGRVEFGLAGWCVAVDADVGTVRVYGGD